jgi:hypothetical protein
MALKPKTQQEIDAEIKALRELKTTVPKKTFFGDDNHEKLDAQIETLEKRMTKAQAEQRWYVDESAEEYSDGDNELYFEVCAAIEWMNGDPDQDAPSEGWR